MTSVRNSDERVAHTRQQDGSPKDEKAKLHLEAGPKRAELRTKLLQAEADSTAHERKCQQLETLNKKLTAALAKANDKREEAAAERDDLSKQLLSEQKMHEREIKKMHKSKEAEISGNDKRLNKEYQKKIDDLEQQVTQQRDQNSTADHNSKQSELKSENVKLKKHILELEKREQEHSSHRASSMAEDNLQEAAAERDELSKQLLSEQKMHEREIKKMHKSKDVEINGIVSRLKEKYQKKIDDLLEQQAIQQRDQSSTADNNSKQLELESENVELKKRIAELETRLAETCQLLDASAEEKAKLVLEDGAKIAELEELRTKLIQAEAESSAHEKRCQQLETLDKKLTADLDRANDEKEEAVAEKEELSEQLVSEQKMHEKEIKKMHKNKDAEISGIVSRLKEKYRKKIADLEEQETQERSQNNTIVHNNSKQLELESQNVQLEKRIAELGKSLADTRQLLDVSNKEKSKLDSEDGPKRAELKELRTKFIQAEADSTASEKKCQQLETIDNKLTADLAQAYEEKEEAVAERDELSKQIVLDQKMHEKEIKKMHKSKDTEISGIVEKYQKKIDDLKEQVTQRRGQNNTYDEELRKARTKLIDFNSKQSELESANAKMKKRIAELEKRDHAHSSHLASAMADTDADEDQSGLSEASSVRRKGARSRIPLAVINRNTRKDAPSSPLTDGLESNGKGDVNIVDVEPGKVIRIINNGKNPIPLKGWQIVQNVNESKMIYKFHHKFKLAPGSSASVWSSGADIAVEPLSTPLEMKTGLSWLMGPQMKTQLMNGNGEEMDEKVYKILK